MSIIKLALPKGSLEKATFAMFERAGYIVSGQDRSYRPVINDPDIEIKILRPQEIPIFVAEGVQDVGVSGQDWIRETRADVEVLLDLEYGRVRLVVAVPSDQKVKSFDELAERLWNDGRALRVSTEYLRVGSQYVRSLPSYKKRFGNAEPLVVTPWWRTGTNQKASLFLSFGATEAKPPEDADAIIDVIETGSTLSQNNLRPIETIFESTASLIANKAAIADPRKHEKIIDLLSLLKGVVDAQKRLHIFVNVEEKNLDSLVSILPALKGPTISKLSREGWYSVNTVIEKQVFLEILPKLRKLAQGLVVHEPRQIMPLEEIARGGNGN